MGTLCFGTYSYYFRDASLMQNEDVINLLCQSIAPSFRASSINEGDRSRLIRSQYEVPIDVKSPTAGIPAIDIVEAYFRAKVVPKILSGSKNLFLTLLDALISSDKKIPALDLHCFEECKSQLPLYLANVFLYAVQRPNKHKTSPLPEPVASDNIIVIANGRLWLNGVEVKLPDKLEPPETPARQEATYIAELLRAYADAECVDCVTFDAIPQKYRKNFNEQRQHYFSAEAIRRRTRDVFLPADDPFTELKENVYNGISATYDNDYENGYKRLLAVLQQAAALPDGVAILEKQLGWIRAKEKMGVCHILVNDRKIEAWVVPNE